MRSLNLILPKVAAALGATAGFFTEPVPSLPRRVSSSKMEDMLDSLHS